MKLKTIPDNIVVHTPTEKEAKELLGFLHENGYSITTTIREMKMVNSYKDEDICFFIDDENWGHCTREWCEKKGYTILTLAEFKKKYVDTCTDDCSSTVQVEKSQPKFSEGDLVMFPKMDRPLRIHTIVDGVAMSWWDDGGIRATAGLDYLQPYTEPETKEKEQGEKGNNSENSQLNLCELLKGHEGELFYSLIHGTIVLSKIDNTVPYPLYFKIKDRGAVYSAHGHYDNLYEKDATVVLYPSRTPYEQYPLDPLKAWQKWKEEQKKPFICIHWGEADCNGDEEEDYTGNTYFRTTASRDKAIEEIKAIIEKYSKK